jgi:hypothetical protein
MEMCVGEAEPQVYSPRLRIYKETDGGEGRYAIPMGWNF